MSSLHKATGADCANSSPRQDQVETYAPIVGDDTVRRKRYETLRALLALKGFQLIELTDGGYLVCRWDRSAHVPCLRGVSEFLIRIGGQLP